jgi:hypothetical protein
MMLKQVFKTAAGADKRALFETRHSFMFTYRAVRVWRGEPDRHPFDRGRFLRSEYTWQLERTLRVAA